MTTNIKRIIGRLTDQQELREIEKACAKRRIHLREQEYLKEVTAHWETVRSLPAGAILYVCANGTFFGGPWQRGDSMELIQIQPRALRLWVRSGGKEYAVDCRMAHRYDLRITPPDKPLDKAARDQVERIAGRISEATS